MKKLLLLFATFLLCLTSCNNKDQDTALIIGEWQHVGISKFEIKTNNDSLSAAILYAEIRVKNDSSIMKFQENGKMLILNKDFNELGGYGYHYEEDKKLTFFLADSKTFVAKFEITENIALFTTKVVKKYRNDDGTVVESVFNRLAKEYPETMRGLERENLRVEEVTFSELYKRLGYYY